MLGKGCTILSPPLVSWYHDFPGGLDDKVSAYTVGDWAQSLGREDPLEKKMATHSSTLAWKTMDEGAWWATIHGVAKSWTRLSN